MHFGSVSENATENLKKIAEEQIGIREVMVILGIRRNCYSWSELFAVETVLADQQEKGNNSLPCLPEQGFQPGIVRSGSLGERQGQRQMPLSEASCPHKLQNNVRRREQVSGEMLKRGVCLPAR